MHEADNAFHLIRMGEVLVPREISEKSSRDIRMSEPLQCSGAGECNMSDEQAKAVGRTRQLELIEGEHRLVDHFFLMLLLGVFLFDIRYTLSFRYVPAYVDRKISWGARQ